MNARERLQVMIRTDRGSMTVWSRPEVEDAFAAYDTERRAEVLAEVTGWLVKKAREFRAEGTRTARTQADTAAMLASKVARGAVRPNNLRMLPNPGFFETERIYRDGKGNAFRTLAVDPHPRRGELTAIGWLIDRDESCLIFRMTAADWQCGTWVDATEAGDAS